MSSDCAAWWQLLSIESSRLSRFRDSIKRTFVIQKCVHPKFPRCVVLHNAPVGDAVCYISKMTRGAPNHDALEIIAWVVSVGSTMMSFANARVASVINEIFLSLKRRDRIIELSTDRDFPFWANMVLKNTLHGHQ